MKIKLNTGQVIEERLNRAQRLIRLGKATAVKEEVKPIWKSFEPVESPVFGSLPDITEEDDYEGIPPLSEEAKKALEDREEFVKELKKTKKGKKKKDKVAKSNSRYSNEL